MYSLITNIQNQASYKNINSSQNTMQEKAKKIIERHYENAYKEDMKKHKIGFAMLCGMAITGLTAFFTCKTERTLTGLMGFGSLGALLLGPILKPKKEKYEALMQKELNEVV